MGPSPWLVGGRGSPNNATLLNLHLVFLLHSARVQSAPDGKDGILDVRELAMTSCWAAVPALPQLSPSSPVNKQPTALPAELLSPKSEHRESGATIRSTRLIIGWGAAQRSNLGSACHVIYSNGLGYLHSAVIFCVLRAACVPGLRSQSRS